MTIGPNDLTRMGYTGLRDAYGAPVRDNMPFYLGAQGSAPGQGRFGIWLPNPNYKPAGTDGGPESGPPYNPSPTPTHLQFTFDTIGQTIVRTIGLCRVALKTIWVQGINSSGDSLPDGATTMTFAAAMCAPIDPTEGGTVAAMWDGGSLIFDPTQGGAIVPDEWDDADQALFASLGTIRVYPGTEYQLPDPTILADKGIAFTNAFRGLRYIVFINYPIKHGLPNLSVAWKSPGQGGGSDTDPAVEFAAGAG